MSPFASSTRWVAIAAGTGIALSACGSGSMTDGGDPGETTEPAPSFQTVEIVLQSWDFSWDGTVEVPLTDVELQVGWALAYPVRQDENQPGILQSRTGVEQKGDIPGGLGDQNTIWSMNRVMATYDEYCDDPEPQLLLTLLEVDEGFDQSGTQTRAALGALAVGVGLAFPVSGAVFGSVLVLEGLFAKNDDVGQGTFTINDGSNRLRERQGHLIHRDGQEGDPERELRRVGRQKAGQDRPLRYTSTVAE